MFDRRTSRYLPFDREATDLLRQLQINDIDSILRTIPNEERRAQIILFFEDFYAHGFFTIEGKFAGTILDVEMIVGYLANLSRGRLILWCYFIWYCVILVRYFDPNPRLWLTSLGISLLIGIALYISTTATDKVEVRLNFWKTFRLFLSPFCTTSFAALVKGKGFILIFSPHLGEVLIGVSGCVIFWLLVFILKRANRARAAVSTGLS